MDDLKKAFEACGKPLVCLDGYWLKGTYGEKLLATNTIDLNDCILPVSWAVVRIESIETWTWFLSLLKVDLGMLNSHYWVFMSDRQKVML